MTKCNLVPENGVNVLAFGADASGATDSSTAFAKAVEKATKSVCRYTFRPVCIFWKARGFCRRILSFWPKKQRVSSLAAHAERRVAIFFFPTPIR